MGLHPKIAILPFILFGVGGLYADDGIARFLDSRIAQLDEEITALEARLAQLPEPPSESAGGSRGYHSWWGAEGSFEPTDQVKITIDLGREALVETVVLIPAEGGDGIAETPGYGFPVRFAIDLSTRPYAPAVAQVADFSETPFANPGRAPVIFDLEEPVRARYVRLIVSERWVRPDNGFPCVALGECLVFAGGHNIALWCEVPTTGGVTQEPLWSNARLVDGQSALGYPRGGEPSPTNGLIAASQPKQWQQSEVDAGRADWVQLDFGERLPIERVELYPTFPLDRPLAPGFGFPPKFRVDVSDDPAFASSVTVFEAGQPRFSSPGNNRVPIPVPADTRPFRYLRVTALPSGGDEHGYYFSLSEIAAFVGGKNVAIDAIPSAPLHREWQRWTLAGINDGFDSRNEILHDELGWLRGIAEHAKLSAELGGFRAELVQRRASANRKITTLALALGVAAMLLSAFFIRRVRRQKRTEVTRIRKRIARDLHDEIGSNLGSITLLSQVAANPDNADPDDLAEITRISQESGETMRDLVWVLEGGSGTLADLASRMREAAGSILRTMPYTFVISPEALPTRRIGLDFRRHVLLLFKEALHNVVRHAEASQVEITVTVRNRQMLLEIKDDGLGFDLGEERTGGSGLKNLKARARDLCGRLDLQSSKGNGTSVLLETPLP